MTAGWWGAALGGLAGAGLLLVFSRVVAIRRPSLAGRVMPYLRDRPRRWHGGPSTRLQRDGSRWLGSESVRQVLGPSLASGGELIDRLLGGSASIERRLRRAGLDTSVREFRAEQVVWGLVGFAATAAVALLEAARNPDGSLGSLVVCLTAFAAGVLLRENRLTAQVRTRERRMLTEFPALAELLALAVAAGEGPVAALDRVVRRSRGELSSELARVLASIRTGETVAGAFDRMAAETGLPAVARFAQGIAVAVERGTPLSEVLHAQAADVREAGRRELIETAARKEVAMMVPVVFLILPVTVLFAFWPGVVGLTLTTP